jgi:serine/threonine protein phosphatase PrpC
VPNQDSTLFARSGDLVVFGIANGGGERGHWASHWVSQYALALLLEDGLCNNGYTKFPDQREAYRIFNTIHDALVLRASHDNEELQITGCSLSLCFVDCKTKHARVAWVGDSMCVRGLHDGTIADVLTQGELLSTGCFTGSHSTSPYNSEHSRCSRNSKHSEAVVSVEEGNPVISHRLGALTLHEYGGYHTPCASKLIELGDTQDQFLLCASAGVWDAVEKEEAIPAIARAGRHGVDKAVDELVQLVCTSWDDDDDEDETEDASLIAFWV